VVQVVGCVKNTMLVWVGMLMGDHVTPEQLAGYTISVLGFALYTRVKMREGAQPNVAPAAKKAA
jgi:hypothetical protein